MKIYQCRECSTPTINRKECIVCKSCYEVDFVLIADTDDRKRVAELKKQLRDAADGRELKHCENHNKYESWCPSCMQREYDATDNENDLMRLRIKQQDARIAELEKQLDDDGEKLRVIVEDNHTLRKLVESHSCESCFAKEFCVGRNAMKCADVQTGCHREQARAALKEGE